MLCQKNPLKGSTSGAKRADAADAGVWAGQRLGRADAAEGGWGCDAHVFMCSYAVVGAPCLLLRSEADAVPVEVYFPARCPLV